ncbi:SMC family ATPase [Geobacter sp. 60473]|uniref:SMC family ATPase n=1 Tax=Geobacter sp. 60473 TaxID=3080755 RepID=UPI002B322284|nr:SMC family ATPase [Geobacter sp. 60473]
MQILSIHMKNIKSHRDTELTFSAGINVLSGPNGVGKSTVFEAIGYALFGVDARDFVSNVDRFLSIGTKKGEIAVTFSTDAGKTWRVTRTVGTPAKWLLAKEQGGVFEVEEHARIEETEARIAELLGLNNGRPLAEQFKLVIGPFQNEFLGPFVIKQPTKRQEAFDEILGIDAWRKTFKNTSSLLSAVQEKVKLLAVEIEGKENQLAVLPEREEELAKVKTDSEALGKSHGAQTETLRKVEKRLAELDGQEKGIAALQADIQILANRITDGEGKIRDQKQRVGEAEKAGTVLEQTRPGKEAYEKAEAMLVALRGKEQQRREVEKEVAILEKEAQRLTQSVEHEQKEVQGEGNRIADDEAALAKARKELLPDKKVAELAARLTDLRNEVNRLRTERGLLEGRRAALLEGQEKLGEGMCPFFKEPCQNVAGTTPQDVFTARIADLDRQMHVFAETLGRLSVEVAAAEEAEKELAAITVRGQELDKQTTTLAERRTRNQERAGKLQGLVTQQAEAAARVKKRKDDLQFFVGLDAEIEAATKERGQFQADRDAYHAHEKDALDLDNRRQTLEKMLRLLDDLQKQLGGKKDELARLQEAYQHDRHREARDEKDRLVAEVASLRQKIENMEKDRLRLEGEIGKLKVLKEEIDRKLAEKTSYEQKEKLVKFLRNQVFKNVSAQLSERFREEIRLRADRIYRTIAETDEELVWGENYQIVLRDMADGAVRERSDDQLSGGQTMSAVVALRLALLQTIGARIAFFDEPTSNLDASRRENLATAFRAIDVGREEVTEHWYDQLFLISHDVAFTEITDQMIQLGE